MKRTKNSFFTEGLRLAILENMSYNADTTRHSLQTRRYQKLIYTEEGKNCATSAAVAVDAKASGTGGGTIARSLRTLALESGGGERGAGSGGGRSGESNIAASRAATNS
eukprot:1321680-Amphidinium_carterae.1